jgi:hypothetical protein
MEPPKERKKSPRFNGFFISFYTNRWGYDWQRGKVSTSILYEMQWMSKRSRDG